MLRNKIVKPGTRPEGVGLSQRSSAKKRVLQQGFSSRSRCLLNNLGYNGAHSTGQRNIGQEGKNLFC
ncbi:hypothetical protein ACFL7M_01640 [Thermodesulfobacteriota bacterium]